MKDKQMEKIIKNNIELISLMSNIVDIITNNHQKNNNVEIINKIENTIKLLEVY